MKKYCLPVAVGLLLGAQDALATELSPIVVTASRTAQTVDESLASVTVITREDIERQQAQSVQDVLRGLPGVIVTNNGGPGKATSVFLRGTESGHVLVLIDGVKIGSATLGSAALQDIPVEQIERIEIVRGPRSSLYGSEAIGGVIQIFTRKGAGEIKPFFSLSSGSFQTYTTSIGVAGGSEQGWFNLNTSGINTKGFNACQGPTGGCFADEPDKDGYRNTSISLRAGYTFENDLELEANVLHANSDTEFDGGSTNESETVQEVIGASLRYAPLPDWDITMKGGRNRDWSDNFKDGMFRGQFDTERETFSWQNDITLNSKHLLTLGADYQEDDIDSDTVYAETSRDNSGAFGQYHGQFGAHDAEFSLRQDDNEQFGHHTTGGLAWGYALRENLRLTASYGTAFKAPSFNDLYYPWYGNPNLGPETSRSLEIGLKGKAGWGHWTLNAYETRIEDLIAYDQAISAASNVNEARIRGLETTLGTEIKAWELSAGLTLLDPENRSSGANQGNLLPRRAEQSLRFDADRIFGKYSVGATLVAAGERYDDLENTEALDSYTTVDLRAGYAFAKAWLAQARIENLFDEDYETAAFFNQPERSLFVTLRYQP